MSSHQLILIRHGESLWNQANRFTGWVDVDLSDNGREEALKAGRALMDAGLDFDCAYTSVLKRAIRTLWLAMDEMDRMWVPVTRDWRLNERHYGALQGKNKSEMREEFGEAQVHEWRRGYAVRPPELAESDEQNPRRDPRYRFADPQALPLTESLADTLERLMPFWHQVLAPALQNGARPLVAAHGNSLRALVKHLEGISDDAIMELNIPTGEPIVYALNDRMEVEDKRTL